jgi:cationic peptide transport system substrate-binding protein
VTVDTLAAQLYDRLLDVNPLTYRLFPELVQSWEVLDNLATYRFHLLKNVPFQTTAWLKPISNLNAYNMVFSFPAFLIRNTPAITSTVTNTLISVACNSMLQCKV